MLSVTVTIPGISVSLKTPVTPRSIHRCVEDAGLLYPVLRLKLDQLSERGY
jgi:hypothetical protein